MEVLRSSWQALAGFWDEAAALNYVRGQGVPLTTEEFEDLREKIARAREYVQSLPVRTADTPAVRDLDDSTRGTLKELESEPTFAEHLQGMKKWEYAWVELSKLVVFQPSLNSAYVESLLKEAPAKENPAAVVQFCLPPTKRAAPKLVTQGFDPVSNTFSVVTDNLDFRILGQVQGEEPESGRKFVGFAYGGGLPQMSVVEYRGRYILKNGYHRAYALFRAGHPSLPCLLLHTDNYAMTGAQAAGFFPLDTVLAEKPPRLEDFSSPGAVAIPRRLLRIMITVHAEKVVFPV